MSSSDGYFNLNVSECSSSKLCQVIATARYLGSLQQEAKTSMEELARRRDAGEVFDYENTIDNLTKSLPDFKIDLKSKINIGVKL